MRRPLTFTATETRELLLSWAVLGLAFAILFNRGISANLAFLITLIIALIITAVAFILHELAHKIAANHYGCQATYHANKQWLFIALIMSFFGFIFAAPGAVMIQGRITKKEQGIIALAGPATNAAAALLFLPLITIVPLIASPLVLINALIATFNLLPLPGFDGSKILAWNKSIYALSILTSIVITVTAYTL